MGGSGRTAESAPAKLSGTSRRRATTMPQLTPIVRHEACTDGPREVTMAARWLALLTLLGGGAARAWEPPEPHDYALLGTSIALNAVDMWSSFDIGAWRWVPAAGYYSVDGCAAKPGFCLKEYARFETNPLLVMAFGLHPTRGQYV